MEEDRRSGLKENFQEPQKRFWMRSRKRRNSDAVSISSMDISVGSETIKKKKRRRITEVASNFFSSSFSSSSIATPGKTSLVRQGSLNSGPPLVNSSFLIDDAESGRSRRLNDVSEEGNADKLAIRSWLVEIAGRNADGSLKNALSRGEIKHQEAIFELCCGEDTLIRDLRNLDEIYYKPLLGTDVLTKVEMETLFGDISALVDLHVEFRDELVRLRDENGFTSAVGSTITNWVPRLANAYVSHCRRQIRARYLLETKRSSNKRLDDFLKKRTSVPRSVDLWTYLDVPRSRIVKYPLLVKEILRHTPLDHEDQMTLKKSNEMLKKLLQQIDRAMGESECEVARSRITSSVFDAEKLIDEAKEIISEGTLKDSRGLKFRCFLFDSCFVLTRPTRRSSRKFEPCFPVLGRDSIRIIETDETENKAKWFGFKVNEHVLVAEDEHSKRHWLEAFRKMCAPTRTTGAAKCATPKIEKENLINRRSPRIRNVQVRSLGEVRDVTFPNSLRKRLGREKRNGTSLI